MTLLDKFFSSEQGKSDLKELVDHLSSRDETVAFFEPLTAGLLSYRFSEAEFASKVLAGSIVPSSTESYQQYVQIDQVPAFPHKEVSNQHDAQLLSNKVRKKLNATHGISVLAPMDGTKKQEVFVGLNLFGDQAGVYSQVIDFESDNIREKAAKFALKSFLDQYSR